MGCNYEKAKVDIWYAISIIKDHLHINMFVLTMPMAEDNCLFLWLISNEETIDVNVMSFG